jgi:glycosyltransferase involved in cell wall biosynthesis
VNVLHISHLDDYGGSARSAIRIHQGLGALGVESRMLVGVKRTGDATIRPLARGPIWARLDREAHRQTERFGAQYLANASSFALPTDPWFRTADIVQLYNIHGGYFAHTALPILTRLRPTVWRLSDMWAATGHCAYPFDSEGWRTGCGSCPYLDTYPPVRRDVTAFNWRVKQAVYAMSRMTLVAPSRWLARIVRESPLLRRFPVRLIANGVELHVFHPRPRDEARAAVALEAEGPVVLVGSLERRKGGALVAPTLGRLAATAGPVTALVMGERQVELPRLEGVRVVDLGMLADRERVALAYAAADVLLYPTLADNVPNTVLESLATGTPAVGLNRGGMEDAVNDGETGFLVEREDPDELAGALATAIGACERMGAAAAEDARRRFSLERQARDFLSLYDEILAAPSGRLAA